MIEVESRQSETRRCETFDAEATFDYLQAENRLRLLTPAPNAHEKIYPDVRKRWPVCAPSRSGLH
jgi:hypothetical protein